MLRVSLDMEIPETCYDCPLQTEPCGSCMIDIPEQRSTYPYCNDRNSRGYANPYLDKPVWCPLEKEN